MVGAKRVFGVPQSSFVSFSKIRKRIVDLGIQVGGFVRLGTSDDEKRSTPTYSDINVSYRLLNEYGHGLNEETVEAILNRRQSYTEETPQKSGYGLENLNVVFRGTGEIARFLLQKMRENNPDYEDFIWGVANPDSDTAETINIYGDRKKSTSPFNPGICSEKHPNNINKSKINLVAIKDPEDARKIINSAHVLVYSLNLKEFEIELERDLENLPTDASPIFILPIKSFNAEANTALELFNRLLIKYQRESLRENIAFVPGYTSANGAQQTDVETDLPLLHFVSSGLETLAKVASLFTGKSQVQNVKSNHPFSLIVDQENCKVTYPDCSKGSTLYSVTTRTQMIKCRHEPYFRGVEVEAFGSAVKNLLMLFNGFDLTETIIKSFFEKKLKIQEIENRYWLQTAQSSESMHEEIRHATLTEISDVQIASYNALVSYLESPERLQLTLLDAQRFYDAQNYVGFKLSDPVKEDHAGCQKIKPQKLIHFVSSVLNCFSDCNPTNKDECIEKAKVIMNAAFDIKDQPFGSRNHMAAVMLALQNTLVSLDYIEPFTLYDPDQGDRVKDPKKYPHLVKSPEGVLGLQNFCLKRKAYKSNEFSQFLRERVEASHQKVFNETINQRKNRKRLAGDLPRTESTQDFASLNKSGSSTAFFSRARAKSIPNGENNLPNSQAQLERTPLSSTNVTPAPSDDAIYFQNSYFTTLELNKLNKSVDLVSTVADNVQSRKGEKIKRYQQNTLVATPL